jgi:hypothetical protein
MPAALSALRTLRRDNSFSEPAWRFAVYFLEYTAEIRLILKTGFVRYLRYSIARMYEHLHRHKHTEIVEVFPQGHAHFTVKNPCQVVFTDADRVRDFPPEYMGMSMLIKIENGFLYQYAGK